MRKLSHAAINGCSDGIDTDSPGALAEVAPVDRIPVPQQMAWLGAQGVASMSCRHTQAAVGLAVTLTCTNSRRPWAMNTSTCSVLNARWGRSADRRPTDGAHGCAGTCARSESVRVLVPASDSAESSDY